MKLEIGDAFGLALRDQYHGADVSEILEARNGYIWTNGSISKYFARRTEWPASEQSVFKAVQGRVLDIGCGAGRQSVYLANNPVTAIDTSPLAVEVAKLRGVSDAHVLGIDDIHQLETRFFRTVLVDLGLLLGGSHEEAQSRLARLRYVTMRDAIVIGSSVDPGTVEPTVLQVVQKDASGNCTYGYIPLRVRHRAMATPWTQRHYIALAEVERRLEGTGWRPGFVSHGDANSGRYDVVIHRTRS